MDTAIWGLVGTIVGAIASIATTWLATLSAHRLEDNRSKTERSERANSFQRQTLIDLQEAIHDALRLVSRAHDEDREAYRATKEWRKNMLSEEVNEGSRLAMRRVAILVARVADDDLRGKVKVLMQGVAQCLLSPSEQDARLRFNKMVELSVSVFEEIGTTLRRHY